MDKVPEREIQELYDELKGIADGEGYILNPDREILWGLLEGLLINEKRYGYRSCPCRLASGNRIEDFDIICPCEYRDPDLEEYGRCYCALYVDERYVSGERRLDAIPERRSTKKKNRDISSQIIKEIKGDEKVLVWRCTVCGYLCARPDPPPICPICRARKEKFEIFELKY
jgi:ferredoxin-thioredoxin reductase catalytic subunit/rubredoxin